jgi:hypothetical protein
MECWNWKTFWPINCSKDKRHTYMGAIVAHKLLSIVVWNGIMFLSTWTTALREKSDG